MEDVAFPPSGAVWSQVDQGEETWFTKMKLQNLTAVQHLNVQRVQFTRYSLVETPRTLPSAGMSTNRDTHHNSTPPPIRERLSADAK